MRSKRKPRAARDGQRTRYPAGKLPANAAQAYVLERLKGSGWRVFKGNLGFPTFWAEQGGQVRAIVVNGPPTVEHALSPRQQLMSSFFERHFGLPYEVLVVLPREIGLPDDDPRLLPVWRQKGYPRKRTTRPD